MNYRRGRFNLELASLPTYPNQDSQHSVKKGRFVELRTLFGRLSWSGGYFWAGLSHFGKVTYFKAYLLLMDERCNSTQPLRFPPPPPP
ncbi:MAG TPA: hypothetical protein P5307_27040, partial [Pirellulaceae bacterium]|nr:hypothetical protein [Pirellulaceae bacterium]